MIEEDLPLYHVTLTRDALNDFLTLCHDNVDVEVNEIGEVSIDIPTKSGITVNQINLVRELVEEAELLNEQQGSYEENSKKWEALEDEKVVCMASAVKITTILKKHYEDAIIE